jgi:tetratricopeptide (TPR) repeat protein
MKDRYAGLESLTELIESSLVNQDNRGPEPRLSMLGTVREFALDRLRADFDWADTHERHARYYLAFAEATAPPVGQTSTDPASVDLLEHEHDNLRTAINWLIETEQLAEAVRLGWMLWPLWWLRGHIDEGARTIRRMLEHGDKAPRRAYAHMLFGDGAIAFLSGDQARARVQLERVLPILREVGDQDVNARAAGMLGQLALTRGDYAEARVLLGETKEISERIGELWMTALYHTRLGLVPYNEGDYAAAAEQFTDGLRTARKTDDHLGEVVALYSLAVTATAAGEEDTAAAHLAAGLRLSAGAGDEAGTALYLAALSDLAVRQGDLQRAARLASSADKLRAFAGTAWMQAYVLPWPTRGVDLGGHDYAGARAQGHADSLQSAVSYALSGVEL